MTIKSRTIKKEPLAIIGMGCRFPGGASSPARLWENLCGGVDAITDIPSDRWDVRRFYDPDPDVPGKTYAKQAGFLLEDVYRFDPMFFGISPREAAFMDPQQRLLLEVAWEAIDDAGLQVENINGSNTGVFIGGFCMDESNQLVFNQRISNNFSGVGTALTILSARISYVFNLKGPCISLDTACSSSLVAVHYACQAIWNGECDMAFAGGVNVMTNPRAFSLVSKGMFLSPYSRCKAFDEDAAGYVRGEGAGIVVLKPLAQALRDRDPIYALIRGTGINHDGQTSGITIPNPEAQEALIREVQDQAGVRSGEIHYIEAHGTGTQAGDLAEARALDRVLGEGRGPNNKCLVGSVKTNIGHLEAAAGAAGLIKTALCLKQRLIPGNLHFHRPNPQIPFDEIGIRVATGLEEWPNSDRPGFAGVNSFGFGGTNAHVVLEGPPEPVPVRTDPLALLSRRRPFLVPVSARDPNALRQLAKGYGCFLRDNEGVAVEDFAYTTAIRRSHHDYRLSLVGRSRRELIENLELFGAGEAPDLGSFSRVLPVESRRAVFVYSGMGPHWWAMGRELMEKEPVFRRVLEECDVYLKEVAGWSLTEEMGADEERSRMGETQVAQPAGVALQAALTALWKSWGIEPAAVIGHSVGEIAAAYAAGALSLREAMLVSFHRSRLQQQLSGKGTMLAAALPKNRAEEIAVGYEGVSVAAVNSSLDVTLAGKETALREIADRLDSEGVFNRFLHVNIAYHSVQMEEIRDELLKSLTGIEASNGEIPFYSTVLGKRMSGDGITPGYWWRNVREPVLLGAAVDSLIQDGYRVFLEVGPHPVLGGYIRQSLRDAGASGQVIGSLNRNRPEQAQMLDSLGILYTLGFDVDWREIAPTGDYVQLPGYPWQRERFREETRISLEDRLGCEGHVFLNQDLRLPQPAWEVELNGQFFPFLKDHQLQKSVVFPGAGYVEAGLALNSRVYDRNECRLEDVSFHQLLFYMDKMNQKIQCHFDPKTKEYSVYSRTDGDDEPWILHATGIIATPILDEELEPVDLAILRERCPLEVPAEELYGTLEENGWNYGPLFQSLKRVWRGTREVLAEIRGDGSLAEPRDGYLLHPVVLDAAFQSLLAGIDRDESGGNRLFVPAAIDRVSFFSSPGMHCYSHGVVTGANPDRLNCDISFFDESGNITVKVQGLKCLAIEKDDQGEKEHISSLLYDFNWYEADAPRESEDGGARSRGWIVFASESESSKTLADYIASQVEDCVTVLPGEEYRKVSDHRYLFRRGVQEDCEALFSDLKELEWINLLYLGGVVDNEEEELIGDEALDQCVCVTNLVNALARTGLERVVTLGIVTNGAQSVVEEDRLWNLAVSPLWGLGRLITNEYPMVRCRLVDVSTPVSADEMRAVVDEFRSESTEDDVAVRAGRRFVKQLARVKGGALKGVPPVARNTSNVPVMLEATRPGDLGGLAYQETVRTPPGPGEIEVEVYYSALNYKDFLKAMGLVPEAVMEGTYAGTSLGLECSGRVAAIGEGVEDFRIGDEVVAGGVGFRSFATVPAMLAGHKPGSLSMAEAPVFVGFITAYHGLIEIARLQKGERVLIHNATGGVGLAAVQVAQWVGAEIFATAGSDEKRELLRRMGIKHVMNSRSSRFVDQVRSATQGEGVDVVLNAIAGEALIESFALLAPYGRFIEIGKRDIVENSNLPMREFNRNLTFASVDLDRMAKERPRIFGRLMREVGRGFEEGRFRPLPIQVFPASQVAEAFRLMGQSRHIGKVVLEMKDQEVPVLQGNQDEPLFKKDATYLITGGTGGFGLEAARWMSEMGAGSLVLASRRGANETTLEAVEGMRRRGTTVTVMAVDVTDEVMVKRMVEEIKSVLPPLKGIIHGAMFLEDCFLAQMDRELFARVMDPKVKGSLNLHKYTVDEELDFFISLSSVSSLIGNEGQGNYVAANAFLDAFAYYRRGKRLPATTVNLGVVSEVGVAARHKEWGKLFKSMGIRDMSPRKILTAMGEVIEMNPTQIALFDVDWRRWLEHPEGSASSRLVRLIEEVTSGAQNDQRENLKNQLSEMDVHQRQEFMEDTLRKIMAGVLRMPYSKVIPDQNILLLGMDSIMALELRHSIKNDLGLEITALELLKGPSIRKIAGMFLERMELDSQGTERGTSQPTPAGDVEDENEIGYRELLN